MMDEKSFENFSSLENKAQDHSIKGPEVERDPLMTFHFVDDGFGIVWNIAHLALLIYRLYGVKDLAKSCIEFAKTF